MLESNFIFHNNSALHYVRSKSNKLPLLFFHGFGQDHSMYTVLIQSLARDYQLYIFDLYFHGMSTWGQGEKPLEKKEWKATMELFFQRNNINDFAVAGFSLGGKFALATLESFPDKVKEINLIAPDGIKTSFWYSMATYPVIFRRFFRSMIGKYEHFSALANTINKLKLVDNGLIRFADYQMGTEAKRKRVYYSWVVFRRLSFSMPRIARIINTHKIRTTVIAGKYDKVIVPENMMKLLRLVKNYRFEVLDSGHSGLVQDSLHLIRPYD